MRRTIKNVTLTPNQEVYVRRNYRRMTTAEMGTALGISQSKVSENMVLMGLKAPERKTPAKKDAGVRRGYFNEKDYARTASI